MVNNNHVDYNGIEQKGNIMENGKEYYAFISYKREDEKIAKWLQNELEKYRFPTNLNGYADLPKKIRPTFRDMTDLSPAPLEQAINDALQKSEWIIVVCSPRSAKSVWVCKEAQTFIDMGRADHIIPFVVEGNPFSNDVATECYPDALLKLTGKQELLAANIHEMGREAAVVKVISRMFYLKFDDLWQRHEKMRRKRTRTVIVGSLLLSLLILVISLSVIHGMRKRERIIKENHSRAIAEMAIRLAEQGDYYIAKRLVAAVLPLDVEHPKDRPYVSRAEHALWMAQKGNGGVLRGNNGAIRSIDFSPGGKRIVSGSWDDNDIRVWDSETGVQIGNPLTGHSSYVESVAFCPADSNMVASGSRDGTVRLWNVYEGKQVKEFQLKGRIASVVFSPKGDLLAANSNNGLIRIWNIPGEAEPLDIHSKRLDSYWRSKPPLAFSPDPEGKRIIAGTPDGMIQMWDSHTGEFLGEWKAHKSEITAIAYSPDGRLIATGTMNDTVRIWDSKTTKKVRDIIEGNKGIVNSVSFSPEIGSHVLLTSSQDNRVRLWNKETGQLIGEPLIGHTRSVSCAIFSPDGKRIASSSWDRTIRIWDINDKRQPEMTLRGHTRIVRSIAYCSRMNRIVSGSQDSTVRVWDSNTGQLIMEPLTGHMGGVNAVAISEDGNVIVSASWDKTIRVWDGTTGKQMCVLQGHKEDVKSVDISSDGSLIVSGSMDGTVRVWDWRNQQELVLGNALYHVRSVSINATSDRIVSGSDDRKVRVWHLDSGTGEWVLQSIFQGHTDDVYSVSFHPKDNIIVSGSYDRTARVWNYQDSVELYHTPFDSHRKTVYYTSFNSNGERIVTCALDGVRLWRWNGESMELLLEFCDEKKITSYRGVSLSPDGKRLVWADEDGNILIYNISAQDALDKIRESFPPLSPKERRQYYLD